MDFMGGRSEELNGLYPCLPRLHPLCLLRAANNNRGNNGYLVTPWALKASHQ